MRTTRPEPKTLKKEIQKKDIRQEETCRRRPESKTVEIRIWIRSSVFMGSDRRPTMGQKYSAISFARRWSLDRSHHELVCSCSCWIWALDADSFNRPVRFAWFVRFGHLLALLTCLFAHAADSFYRPVKFAWFVGFSQLLAPLTCLLTRLIQSSARC